MPSPFPGMDPYIESPDWFPDLRSSLITHLKAQLNRILPESYHARSDYRYWTEYTKHPIGPEEGEEAQTAPQPAGPLVIAVETIEQGPFKQAFLEVRRRRGKEVRLVTAIEILSPYDKESGHPLRGQYLERQRKVLGGDAHLVEIDLLRGGADTAAIPRKFVEARAGSFDYPVSIHRFDRPDDYFVCPISMRQCLPEIAIPLMPGDADVPLDIQAAFDKAYEGGPYGREVEYGKDRIVPRLKPEQAAWVAELLGRRKRRG